MRGLIKIGRDLWLTRGRVMFMVLALAAGLTSLGVVLSMRGVLQREMRRNYLDTTPASVTFDVGDEGVSTQLLESVRERPEVAVAERRATMKARWRLKAGSPWGRSLLFVFENFDQQRLAKVKHEAGSRTPLPGSVLVERSALQVIGASIGDSIEVAVAGGRTTKLRIAGVVHDPALAPAASEQAGYFYTSVDTLKLLADSARLDELRVVVAEEPLDAKSVDRQVASLAAWLGTQGVELHDIRVPPTGQHPHESASQAILTILVIFAGLTVVLASVLCASLLATTLARQVREIGIIKVLGATRWQIGRLFTLMLAVVTLAAIAVSSLPTILLAHLGIDAVASLLNFDIQSYAVPLSVYSLQVAAAFLLPLLTAAPVLIRASRVSVHEALSDHGARLKVKEGISRIFGSMRNRVLQAGLKNALRVPRRLVLTICLLATGGALFMSAVNVAEAWERLTAQVYQTRFYDIEAKLAKAADPSILNDLSSVRRAELWGSSPVTLANESGLPMSRTYPDGGHGSFALMAVPNETQLVKFKQLAGRWLQPGEPDGLVLNQMAAARFGPEPIGRAIRLVVNGRSTDWNVVGIVEEVAAPAIAYVSHSGFNTRIGQPLNTLRISLTGGPKKANPRTAINTITGSLEAYKMRIVSILPLELLFNAMAEHVVVLVRLLLALSLLMAVVGVMALGSSLSTSVVERTKEFGILRAVGARPIHIIRMVLVEGMFATLLSLPLAFFLAAPISLVVGRILGELAFHIPLPLEISWVGVTVWVIGALAISTVASVAPARTAVRQPVRIALAHV